MAAAKSKLHEFNSQNLSNTGVRVAWWVVDAQWRPV